MKLLARYLLKELLVPLGVWVAFMFLLLFVMQFLRGTDVLLGSAVTLSDLGRLVAYLAPHFLVMALPIAFLLAILLGLGRLGEDRELTSLQALGISPLQLLAAPLGVGLALSAFMVLLTSTVEPWGLTGVKELVGEVIQKNVAGDVKSGVFYEDLSDLTAQINVGLGGSLSRRNRFRSPKEELTPVELIAAAKDAEERKEDPRPFLMALHSRLGNAVAPVAFALLATPLAIGRRQAGRAWGYLLTLGGYVLYYLLSRAFEQMGQKGQMPVLVAGQLSNVLFMVVGAVALYRVTRSGTVR
ncbi:MAG: YjgP/YjgQ family permease [Myxococcaceae bacterium]|nr:MAG: YjgP/YjgQ family permease [Myxococcaceae bacterium]